MNDEELKQVFEIFTAAWKFYKGRYPPSNPEDDTYWKELIKEMDGICNRYNNSRLAQDLLCAAVRDLENKSKMRHEKY